MLDDELTPSTSRLAGRLGMAIATTSEHLRYLTKILRIEAPPAPRPKGWQLHALNDYLHRFPYVAPTLV